MPCRGTTSHVCTQIRNVLLVSQFKNTPHPFQNPVSDMNIFPTIMMAFVGVQCSLSNYSAIFGTLCCYCQRLMLKPMGMKTQ